MLLTFIKDNSILLSLPLYNWVVWCTDSQYRFDYRFDKRYNNNSFTNPQHLNISNPYYILTRWVPMTMNMILDSNPLTQMFGSKQYNFFNITNRKAQMTIVGLLMIFLGFMVLSIIMPTIISNTNTVGANLTAGGYPNESLLYKLIPLFLIGTFIATIAIYGSPQQWRGSHVLPPKLIVGAVGYPYSE